MRHCAVGSLFAGYGGLDLALSSLSPARTAWVADIEPGPRRVLARRFPDAPNLGDVTTVDWDCVEPVDIIVGGSPCQDLSTAGRRAGMRPGTRSGLWESMAAAIHWLTPPVVIWENVAGALSAPAWSRSDSDDFVGARGWTVDQEQPLCRALGRVAGDLASLGYDAQWATVRASDVGAPHRRARLFLLATWREAAADALGIISDWPRHTWGGRPESPDRDPRDVMRRERGRSRSIDFGAYAPAITRWEALTCPSPPPTEPARRGGRRLSARFVEWMMGLPEGWVTDVPGVSRTAQLRMLGNGVVPQQAAHALSALADWAPMDGETPSDKDDLGTPDMLASLLAREAC